MSVTDVSTYDTLTAESARQAAEVFVDACNSHDTARVLGLLGPDVRWDNPYLDGGRTDGTPGVRAWLDDLWRTFPDIVFVLDGEVSLALDGRSTTYTWTATGTMTGPLVPPGFAPTGRRVEALGVDQHWYRDGRLARWRTVTDLTAMARQIGAAPRPHSAGERMAVGLQRLVAARMRRSARR
jgi:hypothetical protein